MSKLKRKIISVDYGKYNDFSFSSRGHCRSLICYLDGISNLVIWNFVLGNIFFVLTFRSCEKNKRCYENKDNSRN